MPFYTMPSNSDLSCIACRGLAENYANELAAQLNKDPSELNERLVKACLVAGFEHNVYTQVLYDNCCVPRAVFGMSSSGYIALVETQGVDPMTRVKWVRATRTLPETLRRVIGVDPWCYSDERNGKAARLLKWYHFKREPLKDIILNGYKFNYWKYVPVAERKTS